MDPKQLRPYEYCPLQDAGRDIRIVEVLPGQFHDSLRAQIHHTPLVEPPEVADTRMTIGQLRATLPEGWDLFCNSEDKYVFWLDDEAIFSWEHPDPRVDKATYELPTCHNELDPHYEALSYVWGSDHKPHHLTVEGEQGCTQIAITDSLMSALRHLRRPNEPRRLWIDAICINQNDHVEVASQVQRMGIIYKLAYRVVVWLGSQSDDSAHALATLDYIGAQLEIDRDYGDIVAAPFAKEPTWWRYDSALPYSQHTWNAVLQLLLRPWFTRVWTVQEVQLGSKRHGPIFQCGMETINLSKLSRALRCLAVRSGYPCSNYVFGPALVYELGIADEMLKPMVNRSVFRRVLRFATMNRHCKDGRDKIYGTLSLLPQRFAAKIKVDYGRSNTSSQVYKKAFLAHAQHVERLELFSNCFMTGRTIPDAPSWVPDWGSYCPEKSYHRRQFATSTSRAHFRYSDEEPDLLEVLGVSCAVVSHVSDSLPESFVWQDAVHRLRQWQPRDLDTATYTPTGEPLRKAYACTLIEQSVAERCHGHMDISIEEWVDQPGDLCLFGDLAGSPVGLEAGDQTKMDTALQRALSYCGGHAFVQTHEGYIGLVPPETRPGDVVAIFLGCSNPLVLRPEQGRYSVVGESFIYGLGDAIKLLGPLPEPWRVIALEVLGREPFHFYFDPRTLPEEPILDDPRLEPLRGWERIDRCLDGDDPIDVDIFEHRETGNVVNYDPRLEPEMLEKRGVQLEWFSLV